MNRRLLALSTVVLSVVVSMPVVSSAWQQKVLLAHKAKAGDVFRVLTEATMSLTMNGNAVSMGAKEVDKITITAVAADGAISVTSEAESSETSIMGQTMPNPPQPPTTMVVRSDGSLVSYSKNGGQSIDARVHTGSHVMFSDKPVGVGDGWTREFKGGDALNLPAASGDYKLVAFEKVGTVDTAKITFTFHEMAADALASTGTLWVDTATGLEVKSEYELKNLPVGPGALGTATVKVSRVTSGS